MLMPLPPGGSRGGPPRRPSAVQRRVSVSPREARGTTQSPQRKLSIARRISLARQPSTANEEVGFDGWLDAAQGNMHLSAEDDQEEDAPVAEVEGGEEGGPLDGVLREVKQRVVQQALMRLKLLWFPRVHLKVQRVRRRLAMAHASAAERDEVAQLLSQGAICTSFSPEAIARIVGQGLNMQAEAGRVLVHQGETAASGLLVLTSGSLAAMHKPPAEQGTRRAKGIAAGQPVCTYPAPIVLGELSVLTAEPWVVSLVAQGAVRYWVIPARCFIEELNSLPESTRTEAYERSFRLRAAHLPRTAPMSHADLRKARLFDFLTDSELDSVLPYLQPCCFQAKTWLCRYGESAKELYFLKVGIAEIHAAYLDRPQLLPTGAAFGEMAYIFGRKRTVSVYCATHCDAWSLKFDDLDLLVAQTVDLKEKIMRAARTCRRETLQQECKQVDTTNMLARFVRRSPVFGEACSAECLREVAASLQPAVYMPGDVVASSVDLCSELLVVAQGRLRVQHSWCTEPPCIEHGDVVGFTCAADHRWLFALVAVSGCDVWSIERNALCDIVTRHGHLPAVAELTRIRLNTELFDPISAVLSRRPLRSTPELAAHHIRITCGNTCPDERLAQIPVAKYEAERMAAATEHCSEPPLLHPVPGLPPRIGTPVLRFAPPAKVLRLHRHLFGDTLGSPCGSPPRSPASAAGSPPRGGRSEPRRRRRPRTAGASSGSRRCWLIGGETLCGAQPSPRRKKPASPDDQAAGGAGAGAGRPLSALSDSPTSKAPGFMSQQMAVLGSAVPFDSGQLGRDSLGLSETFNPAKLGAQPHLLIVDDDSDAVLTPRGQLTAAELMHYFCGLGPLAGPAPLPSRARMQHMRNRRRSRSDSRPPPPPQQARKLFVGHPPPRLRPSKPRHALLGRAGLGRRRTLEIVLPRSLSRWRAPPGCSVGWGEPPSFAAARRVAVGRRKMSPAARQSAGEADPSFEAIARRRAGGPAAPAGY
eukprot:TRINITY_DN6083_c1_g1_i3.p1 TRINITY_DN6083_c1_g1~~TRINITY_DN6083_c1_g1_i3.p1  ORF type:complete len:1012 (+),score=264.33 TRINITY_DN6083_c1_g1_i3:83-3037(+)